MLNQATRPSAGEDDSAAQPSSALLFRRRNDTEKLELIDLVVSSINTVTANKLIRTPVTLLLAMSIYCTRMRLNESVSDPHIPPPIPRQGGSTSREATGDDAAHTNTTQQAPGTIPHPRLNTRPAARLHPYGRPMTTRSQHSEHQHTDAADSLILDADAEPAGSTLVYQARMARLRSSPYKVSHPIARPVSIWMVSTHSSRAIGGA